MLGNVNVYTCESIIAAYLYIIIICLEETYGKETCSRIMQTAMCQRKMLESQQRESTRIKSHSGGMTQCNRRGLDFGKRTCSENGKEREKKTIRRGTDRPRKKPKGL